MADFTPAPKPSQRKRASGGTGSTKGKGDASAPAQDDAKSGVVDWSPEYLKKHPAKLKELAEAPDGTPGKAVAVAVLAEQERDKAAAPLKRAAVQDVKKWKEIHGKAEGVMKSLAGNLARLRTLYTDARGNPDMTGRSAAYTEVARSIYRDAGLDEENTKYLQGAVRYHASDAAREIIRDEMADARAIEGGDTDKPASYEEWCEYYGINPLSINERRKAPDVPRLPAVRFPTDDPAKLFTKAVAWAHKALEAPGDADPSSLEPEAQSALREELRAVRETAEAWLEMLGEEADDDAADDADADKPKPTEAE